MQNVGTRVLGSPARHDAMRGVRGKRTNHPAHPAFTLIELLVVVAILSLLISILIPSLRAARAQAQSVVCRAHEHDIGIGMAEYMTTYRGFIPGPNTSGYHLLGGGKMTPDRLGNLSTSPISPGDWMSPVFGKSLSLPTDRNQRLVKLCNNDFRCPSNYFTYDSMYGNSPYSSGLPWPAPGDVYLNSYSMTMGFTYYFDQKHAASCGQPAGAYFNGTDAAVDIRPGFHNFQIDRLARPSTKVMVVEGARYIDINGQVSFNADEGSPYGDNFLDRGPTLNVFYQDSGSPYKFKCSSKNSPDYPQLNPVAAKYTYRHYGQTLNAVFFDGHAVSMGNEESRRIGYWYPTGSIVKNPDVIGDPTVKAGTVVP